MSEASELLKSLSDVEYAVYSTVNPVDDVIEIDAEGRFVNIPRTEVLLGAETDMDVERKYFKCPRFVGDNIDLKQLQLRVNFQNANGDRDSYIVQDVKVNGQYIEFSWLLSHKVLTAKGEVLFTIQAVAAAADGVLKNRWNTTLAKGTVLESLVVEDLDYIEEAEARDILLQLLQMMDDKSAESIQRIQTEGNNQVTRVKATGTEQVQSVIDKGIEVRATIPEDYQTTYAMADEGIRTKADAITNTVKGEGTLVVKDASNDPLRGLKMYGKTKKQVTTNGYQLFDASKLPTKTMGGATVTNNGDGSFTISGSGTITEGIGVMHYYRSEDTLKMLKPGNITLKSSVLYPYAFAQLVAGNDTLFAINNLFKDEETVTITQEMLDTPNCQLLIGLYGIAGNAINPGTIKPMLYQDGDGTWEPFSGGKPSPSPDYPQEIDNLGGLGNLLDSKPFGTTPYKINGVTISPIFNSYGEVDYFILNGSTEVQSGSSRAINLHVPVEKNTDYILSGSHNNTGVYLYAAFGGAYYPSGIQGCKFNSGDNTEIAIELGSHGNSSFNNEKVYPMLVKADSGITTYRPYTGQQEIEHVITGKNLFDKNICKYTNVAVSGGNIFTASERTRMYYMEVSPNTSYIYTKTLGSFLRVTTCQYEPASGVGITSMNSDTAAKSCIITTGPNDKYLTFFPLLDSEIDTISYEKVLDSIAITMRQSLITNTPHGLPGMPLGQTIPDVIKNSPAHMSGVYWDEEDQQYYISDTVNYETGKYEQRVYHVVSSNITDWRKDSTEVIDSYYWVEPSQNKTLSLNLPCYCNRFTHKNYPYVKDIKDIFGFDSSGLGLYFNSEIDNLEDWKAWVSEHEITVQYILAEPTTRDLTATEMAAYRALRTNKPTTVIFNDCNAYMDVKYNVDLEIKMEEDAAEERYESDLKYSGAIVQTIQGESLVATDSAKAPFLGMKLFGKTEQVSTTGKNLAKSTYVVQSNAGYQNVLYLELEDLQPDTYYTLSFVGASGNRAYINEGIFTEFILNNATGNRDSIVCKTKSNLDKTSSNQYMEGRGWIILKNSESNTVKASFTNVQFECGNVATEFEPFTGGQPSPNPNYPQALNSAGQESGHIESVVYGKNLADTSSDRVKNGYYYDGSGQPSSNTDPEMIRIEEIPVLPNTTYTISSNLEFYTVWLFDGVIALYKEHGNRKNTLTFTTPNNATGIRVSLINTSGNADTVAFEWLQLELGDTPTEYEPYKQPQSLITPVQNGLPGIEVTDSTLVTYIDSNGKMWCCDEIDLERGKYVQRVSEVVYDGSSDEEWKRSESYGYLYIGNNYIMTEKPTEKIMLSDRFVIVTYNDRSNYTTPVCDVESANNIGYIQFRNTNMTVDELRLSLQANPVTVQYILREPIIRDLTPEELKAFKALRSNYPNTTVFNDANAHMEVSYVVDTKKYIDNKFAELAALLTKQS